VGLFIFRRIMFEKGPTTIDEQINLLKERGLGINDEDYAKHFLSHMMKIAC